MSIVSTIQNENINPAGGASSESETIRECFYMWLSAGKTKKFSPNSCVSCLDSVSEYAIKKKICICSLWTITQFSVFEPVYRKLLDAKLLRITEKNTYKTFIVAGQLYAKFLKEKSWVKADSDSGETLNSVDKITDEGEIAVSAHSKYINPENVISWLVTQPNTNGTLYLENVARQYMYALRSVPTKLQLSELVNRNAFACDTASKLAELWETYKTAPNYKQVNSNSSGAFSAGMRCLSRYLSSFSIETFEGRLPHAQNNEILSPISGQDMFGSMEIEKLTHILTLHFANGYRLSSPIEMMRFRSFASKDLGEELTCSDDALKTYIVACGTVYEGKVYVVSIDVKNRIRKHAEDYFANGAQAIFFAEFYAKNGGWLFEANIVSEKMLIAMLRKLFPKHSFTQTYFGYTDVSIFTVLEREILRVWSNDIMLTYDQLAERLPYIPLGRIKSALAQNGDFIWNSVEAFSHISRIEITDDECVAIQTVAIRECDAHAYVSITDLPFGEIEERNDGLSITALHNAVYRICLSDKFDKKGKIVTRKGDSFNALTIMKEYCQTIDKCSLDDLLSYEQELTGEVHRWIPMEAGNTVLVRIDKESYVADRFVRFNSALIDEAIELVVKGTHLPLKSFTTFGAFPDCGQTWNLFLLESYCRRFSQKFRFDSLSTNSKNVGAVIRKSCAMDYVEIMTHAVTNADVPLINAAVGRFLVDNGYTGRSTNAKISEIIVKAKTIRGGLDNARS